ncbi:hypothetical protein VKT23_008953 [Stygiomarasmius scandens]|uniref:F-box domain-containing protein n=1 Tax=Marasmiellus scandens TaxID=2682957 RepID=A0ABR1JID5_9AGAR
MATDGPLSTLRITSVDTQLAHTLGETRLYFAQFQCRSKASAEQILEDGQADLAVYDAAIETSGPRGKNRKALYEKRNELVQLLDACQSQLAPIRRLSYEILGMIFLLCLPSYPRRRTTNSCTPYELSSVCVGWRDVAYGSPCLWSDLDIDVSLLSSGAPFAITTWLTRSKKLPLSIYMKGQFAYGGRSTPAWVDVISSVLKESYRWQHVHFDLWGQFPREGDGDECDWLENIIHGALQDEGLPSLKSLSLIMAERDIVFHPLIDSRLLRDAPDLRSLILEGDLFKFRIEDEKKDSSDWRDFNVSWPHLENLQIRDCTLGALIYFLHHDAFENLSTLSLKNIGYRGLITNSIIFHQMTGLTIQEPNDVEAAQTLAGLSRCIICPILKSLQVLAMSVHTRVYVLAERLGQFLEMIGCSSSLTSLHLRGVRDLNALVLRRLPNIEELTLVEPGGLNNDLCDFLRISAPKLRHLDVTIRSIDTILEIKRLVEMVASRQQSDEYALETLSLRVLEQAEPWLDKEEVQQGLDLLRQLDEKLVFNIVVEPNEIEEEDESEEED